jgi:hypothetical protein
VLIARLDDTNGDNVPNAGDTVVMDRYPITLTPTTAADFEAWRVRSHVVTGLLELTPNTLEVATARGRSRWGDWWPGSSQYYAEEVFYLGEVLDDQGSGIQDGFGDDSDPEGFKDNIDLDMDSPSQPLRDLRATTLSGADDALIDVEIYAR